jgi:hypothetical protein
MSNTILLKRSDIANSVPAAGNLVPGELALNFTDGNLFFKNSSNNIVLLASTQTLDIAGNITGGNLITAGITSTAALSVAGNANVGNLDTVGQVIATGNITGSNLNATGNIATAGLISATGNINGGNLNTAGEINATGNVLCNFILGNGSQLSGINAFSTISVAGQSNVEADSISDTLTFAAGSGIVLLTDAANDVVTIATVSVGSTIFAIGGNMGTVEELVTSELNLGLIVDTITEQNNLGTLTITGLIYPDQFVLPSFTVAELADVSNFPAGQMVFVTNESGGSVPAFSDGINWRRVTDRQIVS